MGKRESITVLTSEILNGDIINNGKRVAHSDSYKNNLGIWVVNLDPKGVHRLGFQKIDMEVTVEREINK